MVAVVLPLPFVVATENVADVFPAAIVTEPCTVAEPEVLTKETTSPPVGAAELTVTVPVEDFPPTTVAGFNFSDTMTGEVTVKVAEADPPFKLLLIVEVA